MAPTETKGHIEVDLNMMREEAAEWAECAIKMSEAAKNAQSLSLEIQDFSFAGPMVGLVEAYGTLQQSMARLLGEASSRLGDMASGLNQTADNYEQQDTESARKIANSYTGGS